MWKKVFDGPLSGRSVSAGHFTVNNDKQVETVSLGDELTVLVRQSELNRSVLFSSIPVKRGFAFRLLVPT